MRKNVMYNSKMTEYKFAIVVNNIGDKGKNEGSTIEGKSRKSSAEDVPSYNSLGPTRGMSVVSDNNE